MNARGTSGRHTGLKSLLVFLFVLAGAMALAPAAQAGSSVGSFEIDGNLAVDHPQPPTEPIDWDTPNLTSLVSLASFDDSPSGPGDTSFGKGSKELEPGGWTCTTGSVPPKDNVVSGQIAFRTFDDPNDNPDLGPQQYAYVNYTRGATSGDAHMDYEFNQSDDPNPACPDVPIRTAGDIVITFDTENGGKQIIVRAFRWNGDSLSGTFTEIPLGTFADGAVNIPNTIPGHKAGDFGEAAINLTQTIGPIACGDFATIYMKTRASTQINSEIKDRTAPQPANPGDCPNSDLDKAVRNVTDNGTFSTSANADPGDTIEYRLTYTNNGNATAHNVTITEAVPEHSTFLNCTGPNGTPDTPDNDCTTTGSDPGDTITWDLGDVEAGGTRTVYFQTQLDSTFPAGSTTITNVAHVTTDEEGTKDSNETTVNVTANPNLSLTKTADITSAGPGDTIQYTLAYSNDGNADASNVVITEPIPAGTQFSSCTGPTGTDGDCNTDGPPVTEVTWDIGTVAAGGSGSVTLTVTVANDVGCQICNTATIQSPDQNSGTPVSSNQVCINGSPGANPAGANAFDSATGAKVRVDGVTNQTLPDSTPNDPNDPSVHSEQHGVGADSQSDQLGPVDIPGVLHADLLQTTSTSRVTQTPPEAEHTSIAKTVGLNVLNGLVTADVVQGVATAHADGSSSSFSSAGSSFTNLVVNGQPLANVAPNTTIKLPAAVFGPNSFVKLREQTGSTSQPGATQTSGGTYSADLSVNMVHVKVTNLDTEVIVSQAKAHADFPQTQICQAKPVQEVSGHAFIASEVTDPELLPVLEGYVDIPASGGSESQSLLSVTLPPFTGTAVSTGVANSSSSGTLSATSSDATSEADAANACLLKMGLTCTITADLIRSQSNSTANSGGASSNAGGTNFVNLVIPGVPPINGTPPPNTTIPIPGIATVILNEQFGDATDANNDGASDLTVRAIHLILLDPAVGGQPGAEVIVAEAHSDAKFR